MLCLILIRLWLYFSFDLHALVERIEPYLVAFLFIFYFKFDRFLWSPEVILKIPLRTFSSVMTEFISQPLISLEVKWRHLLQQGDCLGV